MSRGPFADRIVGGAGINEPMAEELRRHFDFFRYPDTHNPDAEVVVVMTQKVNDAFLDKFPKAKLIAGTGAGYDYADLAALKRRGVQLCNGAGTKDTCGADFAMGLLIATVRRMAACDRHVQNGNWVRFRMPPTRRVSEKKIGIYGLGSIGAVLARRALGFDMEVGYHNRRPRPEVPYRYFGDLLSMAEWCDYLVCACPLTPETRYSVNAEVLKALGPEGTLINIARGAVVDQRALIEALDKGIIEGAGLDVIEGEPEVPKELLGRDNVMITPHVAVITLETQAYTRSAVVDNIETFFRTGTPGRRVDLG